MLLFCCVVPVLAVALFPVSLAQRRRNRCLCRAPVVCRQVSRGECGVRVRGSRSIIEQKEGVSSIGQDVTAAMGDAVSSAPAASGGGDAGTAGAGAAAGSPSSTAATADGSEAGAGLEVSNDAVCAKYVSLDVLNSLLFARFPTPHPPPIGLWMFSA